MVKEKSSHFLENNLSKCSLSDPCGGSCGEGLLECRISGDETCAIPYSSGSLL